MRLDFTDALTFLPDDPTGFESAAEDVIYDNLYSLGLDEVLRHRGALSEASASNFSFDYDDPHTVTLDFDVEYTESRPSSCSDMEYTDSGTVGCQVVISCKDGKATFEITSGTRGEDF